MAADLTYRHLRKAEHDHEKSGEIDEKDDDAASGPSDLDQWRRISGDMSTRCDVGRSIKRSTNIGIKAHPIIVMTLKELIETTLKFLYARQRMSRGI